MIMGFQVNSDEGMFTLGKFTLLWGNRINLTSVGRACCDEDGLGGYFCLVWDNISLEFGEIDQEGPGIYLTTFSHEDYEKVESKTLVKFESKTLVRFN